MAREETTPSESEWLVMEIFWASEESLTSLEVINRLQQNVSMTPRMVRVLINRLCQKNILNYTQDEKDARVYHYFATKSKEDCLREKSQRFVDSYFSGSQTNAVAALLENVTLTDEQITELEKIIESSKGKGKKGKS